MFGVSTSDAAQNVFYTGGSARQSADASARAPDQIISLRNSTGSLNVSTTEFRTAFKYFLLNFTLNGETLYKEKIRSFNLLPWRRAPLTTANVGSKSQPPASSHSIPSLCLDLEHFNMPHWLPQKRHHNGQQDQSQDSYDSQYASAPFEDTASQISEEDAFGSRMGGDTALRWGELLTNAFRLQPLRFVSVAEQVIRELYLELLEPQLRAEYNSHLEMPIAAEGRGAEGGNVFDGVRESQRAAQMSTKHLGLFHLELISRQKPTRLRDLDAMAVESLVTLQGIVVQAYRPQHKAIRVKIRCKQCETDQVLSVPLWRQGVELPRYCAAGSSGPPELRCPVDPYVILSDESEFCDVQTIKIQELPEHVPTGDMPRHLILNAANSLCGRVVPGERVLVVGVYSVMHRSGAAGRDATGRGGGAEDSVQASYVHVLGLSFADRSGSRKGGMRWTFKQEEEFQIMARDPDIHDKIFKSIAPALFGLEDIKKSIACLLFGGSRKALPDGTRLRGDINILLLGDPSTAKSQFLKFVEQAAPIAIYTSGKGSSAAGLTAAVVRDPNRNFALEGGAMVLADGGVVCIDEFDKMRDDDRVAIHEAMEQQTISIAKAGITTVLTTRCSVLAAANPSFGSYNEEKDTSDQHDFETTILSRFDLIWLVKDSKNAERDQMIARHIIELHSGSGRTVQSEGPIPVPKLRDYINYCRSVCDPILSEDAAKKLENFYVEVRDTMRQDTRNRRDQIPVTVRQLESLCRIAEGLAKMSLSRFVTTAHVDDAIQLFRLSTVEAARANISRENLTDVERERVRSAETLILQRLPINGKASKASILRDMKLRGFESMYTSRALRTLIQKGVLEERGDASVKRVLNEYS